MYSPPQSEYFDKVWSENTSQGVVFGLFWMFVLAWSSVWEITCYLADHLLYIKNNRWLYLLYIDLSLSSTVYVFSGYVAARYNAYRPFYTVLILFCVYSILSLLYRHYRGFFWNEPWYEVSLIAARFICLLIGAYIVYRIANHDISREKSGQYETN